MRGGGAGVGAFAFCVLGWGMAEQEGWKVKEPGRPLRPAQCRRWLRNTLAENLPQLTRRFLKDTTPRSCAHMKLVTELIETPERRSRGGGRSVERLIRELEAE